MPTVDVDIKQLLEAGAHFGHKTARWNPSMAPYIHSKRGGSHIIDLTKTVDRLTVALDFVAETVTEGKQVLLVATKRQNQDIVNELVEDLGQPYVTERWLGGMLTNWGTISARVKHLKDLEDKMASGELANKYSKLEVQRFQEEIDAMSALYGGIKNMPARPGVVVVFDIIADANAVKEARKLNVPIVALVDTNADPHLVNYPVPCNDDAIKTVKLICSYLKQAVEAGKAKVKKSDKKGISSMAVDIAEIKRLRELTGVGMTDAKKALDEADGDFDKALEQMRKKGMTKAEKRGEREARAGVVSTYNHDNRIGVLIEVNCETDFVARNEIFTGLVKDLSMQVAASSPLYVGIEDVPETDRDAVKAEFAEKVKAEGKPENMVSKIVEGMLKKYFAERCLLDQPFIKNPDQTIGDLVKEHIAKLGENIIVRRFARMALGEVSE